jgi:uncharacterized protein (TIGR02145 family)
MLIKSTTWLTIILYVGILNLTAQEMTIEVIVYTADTNEPIESAVVSVISNGVVIDSAYTSINGKAKFQFPLMSVRDYGDLPSSVSLSNNYPNPFDHQTNVEMSVPEAQTLTASVYNILGQRVAFENIHLFSGNYTLNLSLGHLPKGVYFLRVGGQESQAVKLVKMGSDIQYSNPQFSFLPGSPPGSMTLNKVSEYTYSIRAYKEQYEIYEVSISNSEIGEIIIPLVRNGDREPGVVTDIDGNVYPIVQIGDQWWMAENLKTTHYRNGDPIPFLPDLDDWTDAADNEIGAYTVSRAGYSGDISDEDKLQFYGALYNWYAATDERGLCPEGWNVPSDGDWIQLERYLGVPEEELYTTLWRGKDQNVGGKLKSTRTGWWHHAFGGATGFGTEGRFGAVYGGGHPYWAWPNIGANPDLPIIDFYDWWDNPEDLNPLDYELQTVEGWHNPIVDEHSGHIFLHASWHTRGTATGGTSNTLTDSEADWNNLEGQIIFTRDALGGPQQRVIVSNTSNTVTVNENWDAPSPGDGNEYLILTRIEVCGQTRFDGNESGFNAIPSGMRLAAGPDSDYAYFQNRLYLWATTTYNEAWPYHTPRDDAAVVRMLAKDDRSIFSTDYNYYFWERQGQAVQRDWRNMGIGITVRCLKD